MTLKHTYVCAAASVLFAGVSLAQSATPTPVDCEAVRCQVQDQLSSCLDNARNHGQCVSCVVHTVKSLGIPLKCRGKVTSCAARSTCGKPNFETCTTQQFGTCDTGTGTCSGGTLGDGLTSCTANTDCITGTRCAVIRAFGRNVTPTPGGDQCTLKGGTPGTGTCCAACPTPTPTT
jgi:hypothetical protein